MPKTTNVPADTLVRFENGIIVACGTNEPEHGSQIYLSIWTETAGATHHHGDGMPKIMVDLNDAEIYDDEGQGDQVERKQRGNFPQRLHAMLYPEEHPEGDPFHDPEHPYWDNDQQVSEGHPYQWSADTILVVSAMLGEELDR